MLPLHMTLVSSKFALPSLWVRLNAWPISCERSSSKVFSPIAIWAPKFDQPLVVAPLTETAHSHISRQPARAFK